MKNTTHHSGSLDSDLEDDIDADQAPAGGTSAAIEAITSDDSERHVDESAGDEAGTERGVSADGGSDATDDVSDDDDPDDDVPDDDVPDDDVRVEELDRMAAGGPRASRSRSAARTEALEREGEVAADFLERLLDIADLDGDIDVDIDGDRAAVAIVDSEDGRVPRRLVGPDGRVLEALQELTRMAVQAATGERSRLMLDVAGHRAERRRIVVAQARSVIDAVTDSGQAQALDPMTAFERKIVHDEALSAGLVSESEGTEPRRFVVIQPH